MDAISVCARLLLVVVFLASGVAKLVDRASLRRAFVAFGVPSKLLGVAPLLPATELAIAILLVPDSSARWAGLAGLSLLLLLSAAVISNLAQGRRPPCHCFGNLSRAPISWRTLVRNGLLIGLAAIVVRGDGPPSITARLAQLPLIDGVELVLLIGLLVLLAVFGLFSLNLLRQQGRLLARIEQLEQADAHHGSDQAGSTGGKDLGLPVGSDAPDFTLRSIEGETVSLQALRVHGKPILLLFTDPNGGPCVSLLPEVAQWQQHHAERVVLALLTSGTAEANRAKAAEFGLGSVLLQERHEVADAYQNLGTPSAVIVDPDGRIASALAVGAAGIRALMERLLAQSSTRLPDLVGVRQDRPPSDDQRHSGLGRDDRVDGSMTAPTLSR
jgi:peroxiredoxin/uncharacterized membrane protein YphA (DoxX/SURF4 family)